MAVSSLIPSNVSRQMLTPRPRSRADVPPLESSFSTLHLSDAVIVILSSESLLSSKASQELLLSLHTKPNLIVCLNTPDASSPSSSSLLKTLRHQLDSLFPTNPDSTSHHNQPIIMALSTTQALEALSALTPSDPTSTSQQPSFESFQLNYLSSQIPKLKAALSTFLSSHTSNSASPTPLQLQTASYGRISCSGQKDHGRRRSCS